MNEYETCSISEHFHSTKISFLSLSMYTVKLDFYQLMEVENKMKSRHDKIHYYENSIKVFGLLSSSRTIKYILKIPEHKHYQS
jgi:hypothetical protein